MKANVKVDKPFRSIKDTTISFLEFIRKFSTECDAIVYLEGLRWKSGIVCPLCGGKKTYGCNRRNGLGYHECSRCHGVFTVRTGTVFERSHVPLTKWLYACYLVITARKGISSIQLAVEIGVTQKTAWFMLHRIRQSCAQTIDVGRLLSGIVEADAAYFGGKESGRHESKKKRLGWGVAGKIAVLGARERGGRTFAKVLVKTDKKTVHFNLSRLIDNAAILMTDEHRSYENAPFAGHMVVRHGDSEFVRGKAYTNGIESVWSVLKRGWVGVYHHFSEKHLQLYVNEFCFRLNEGVCRNRLEERIADMCRFSLGAGHMTYGKLLSRKGDNGLMRSAA